MIYAEMNGIGAFGVLHSVQWILLPLAGIVTAIPLLVYAAGVQRTPFYISGMLMYLNPTMQFLIGVFLFKEEMNVDRLIALGFIWLGIILMLTQNKKKHVAGN